MWPLTNHVVWPGWLPYHSVTISHSQIVVLTIHSCVWPHTNQVTDKWNQHWQQSHFSEGKNEKVTMSEVLFFQITLAKPRCTINEKLYIYCKCNVININVNVQVNVHLHSTVRLYRQTPKHTCIVLVLSSLSVLILLLILETMTGTITCSPLCWSSWLQGIA